MWEESNELIKVLIEFTSKLYSFSSTMGPKNRENPVNEYV